MFRTKRRYAEDGLDEVLRHHNQVNRPRKVDEKVEAHLIALACSPVPDGHDHWTMRALAGKVVELGLVESLSPETVRLRLKKTRSSDGSRNNGAFPRSVESSWRPWRTCWISTPSPTIPKGRWSALTRPATQLLAVISEPLPAKPGRPRREDYEYQRDGTRNLFLTCEPRRGWRHVAITRQRTMQDFAHQMRWMVDEAYPDVPVIRLVLDNLNTHRMASLYETFPAAEARRIAKRLDVPPHAQARELAQHGRDRVQRAGPGLPARTQRRRGLLGKRRQRLRVRAERGRDQHQLAVHRPRRQTQTPSPLSQSILIWPSTSSPSEKHGWRVVEYMMVAVQ